MNYKNKKVTVMGLGLFGGGLGAAEYFIQQGARVTVTDKKKASDLRASLRKLRGKKAILHLGEHLEKDFTDADILVVSPAVPPSSPFIALAKKHGAHITSELNLFFEKCPATTYAVTGSNGKTTTTALLGEMFKSARRKTVVGGNIGKSMLMQLDDITAKTAVVLELSSFQLEDLDRLKKSPHLAILTNLTPNHLDRHGTFKNYADAKAVILKHQKKDDLAVLNFDDPALKGWEKRTKGRTLYFSRLREVPSGAFSLPKDKEKWIFLKNFEEEIFPLCRRKDLYIPGDHNLENALAAAAAAFFCGVPTEAIVKAMRTFKGIEHRLETVKVVKGVRYVNDSIATTPDSVLAALKSFAEPKIVIAGGYDKKISLEDMNKAVARDAFAGIFIGQTGPAMAKSVATHAKKMKSSVKVFQEENLEKAFQRAVKIAPKNSVVMLSPGCASYDQFRNFVQRGRQFKKMVRDLAKKG